ncbi:hypothetical protein DSM104299_00295 [Baekduia alba]|uniref:hypothetical protein n=1 Tax=Baekduia alba TaxID=2997333 RepID=UPI002341B55D|nr:hypothetical protein [Baekduia alba]WCB91622.1 hypothetical protein DSM104299_00295 [Baekduia alba]
MRTLVALLLSSLLFAAGAQAQAPVLATNGSTLAAPANLALPSGANQCLARPYIGPSDGTITFINTGATTCMWWSTEYGPDAQPIANTYVPRGAGAVTRVRVRSGDAPAPLRFAIVSSGSRLCCTAKQVSDQVQPTANAVSEFAVNLPAGSGVGTQDGSQFNDILVVVAVGPGSLPVNDRGRHGFLFGSAANQAQATFLHPALALGESNTDVGIMDGYEVLLQYDWCGVPMTLGNAQPQAPANPQTACLPAPPAPAPPPPVAPVAAPTPAIPTAVVPLGAGSSSAVVRDGLAALRLRCLLTTACAGTLRLVAPTATTAAKRKKPKVVSYGTAKYKIAAGKTATVKVKLSKAAKSALRKRKKVAAVVTGGTGAAAFRLKVTLRR